MRVIFLNRYFYPDHSATSQMLSDLALFLAGAGHEVCVVTSCQRYDDAAAVLPSRERIAGVEVLRVRTTRFGRDNLVGRAADYATFYLAAGWWLWRIARAGDVVVAKTDPPLISVVASFVARRRGARLINWVQDVFPEVAEALGVRACRAAGGAAAVVAQLGVSVGSGECGVGGKDGGGGESSNWAGDSRVPYGDYLRGTSSLPRVCVARSRASSLPRVCAARSRVPRGDFFQGTSSLPQHRG